MSTVSRPRASSAGRACSSAWLAASSRRLGRPRRFSPSFAARDSRSRGFPEDRAVRAGHASRRACAELRRSSPADQSSRERGPARDRRDEALQLLGSRASGTRSISAGRGGAPLRRARRSWSWATLQRPSRSQQCLDLIRDRLGRRASQPLVQLEYRTHQHHPRPRGFTWWHGPEAVVERFGDHAPAIYYPPGAFGQSNLRNCRADGRARAQRDSEGSRVAEFYAGVGAFGLSVLDRVSELRLNEVGQQSLQGLQMGLAALGPADRAMIHRHVPARQARLATSRWERTSSSQTRRARPRPELTQLLNEQPPDRFIYISCGLDSFLQDATQLTSSGRMRLRRADRLQPRALHRARGDHRPLRARLKPHSESGCFSGVASMNAGSVSR